MQGCIRLYKYFFVHAYMTTRFYEVVHDCKGLYKVVQVCIKLYFVLQGCTRLYMVVHGCTRLYKIVQGRAFSEPILKSVHLPEVLKFGAFRCRNLKIRCISVQESLQFSHKY